MSTKDKAIALCRVSTKHQRVEGHSLEQQDTSVRNFAEEISVELVKQWSVDTSSKAGLNIKRKDLEEIREYCTTNKDVGYFLVDRVSRLMREAKRFVWFIVELEDRGVKTLFTAPDQQHLNGEDQMSGLMQYFVATQAEYENKEKALVNKQKMQARVNAGYYPFRPIQGYITSNTPGLHLPDPERFPLLKLGVKKILIEGYTPAQSVKWLKQNGYTTPEGNSLDTYHFIRLISNPFLCGRIEKKDWPICEKGLHEAMITPDEWEKLQGIISKRSPKFDRKKHNPLFPLSQTKCECGGKLVGFEHRNGKGWVGMKYRCRKCGKQHKRDLVHDSLDMLLSNMKISQQTQTDLEAALKVVWSQRQRDKLEQIKKLEKRSAELIEQKNKLIISLAANPDLAEDTKQAITITKTALAENEKNINASKDLEKDLIEFVHFAIGVINNLVSNYWQLSHQDRLKCKRLLFPQDFIVKKDGKVYTPEVSPIFRLTSTKKDPENTSESPMVELVGIAPTSAKLSI